MIYHDPKFYFIIDLLCYTLFYEAYLPKSLNISHERLTRVCESYKLYSVEIMKKMWSFVTAIFIVIHRVVCSQPIIFFCW